MKKNNNLSIQVFMFNKKLLINHHKIELIENSLITIYF